MGAFTGRACSFVSCFFEVPSCLKRKSFFFFFKGLRALSFDCLINKHMDMALSNDVSFHCIISVLLEFLLYVDNVGLVFVCFWFFFSNRASLYVGSEES